MIKCGTRMDAACLAMILFVAAGGCAKKKEAVSADCAPESLQSTSGATGKGSIFAWDPMSESGNANLSPQSLNLETFQSPVTLKRLGGRGVLEGQYVDVRNGLGCDSWFGAYDPSNQFVYPHSDARFQEVMSYHYGDSFRASLDSIGYLAPATSVPVIAHCMKSDNAFFMRETLPDGRTEEFVCLGDSITTEGASYGDDASVIVHELQHATTTDSYSSREFLGFFRYDEAGALNEAISDFMALLQGEPYARAPLDPRVFSRWALGTFIPGHSAVRGAHKCPTYDPSYPNCTGFPGFSADSNTASFVYPDGLGWSYANNYASPGYLRSAFLTSTAQHEIHNAGILMTGALWDVYDAIRSVHGGDPAAAQTIAKRVVLETIRQLPKSSLTHLSPVNFRGFATAMVQSASMLSLSTADQNAISQALTARGLLGGPELAADWLSVGPGLTPNPGLKIEDDPKILKNWIWDLGGDPSIVRQGLETGLNRQLDPGEVAAIWLDLKNDSAWTAGAVEVTVQSLDPDVSFLDNQVNWGGISSSRAQIIYSKVNGTSIVSSLRSSNPSLDVPTSNSFFLTDPFFARDWRTALFVRVSSNAAHGKVVGFEVHAKPSNGAESVATFTAVIR